MVPKVNAPSGGGERNEGQDAAAEWLLDHVGLLAQHTLPPSPKPPPPLPPPPLLPPRRLYQGQILAGRRRPRRSLAAATPLAFPGGALLVKIVRNAFCLHVQNSDSPEKVIRLNQRLSGTWTMLWRNLEKFHAAGFRHDTQVWIVWNRTRATHLQVVLTEAELRNQISTK